MRVLVWIVEDTWRATVAAAAALLPDAEITLLHVTAIDPEAVARGAPHGLLGRRHSGSDAPIHLISEQSARELLAEAQALLGRRAISEARRGRLEREVVAAAENMDLLVLARDGDRSHRGPRSLGPAARFVVDHAPCAVLLVWPDMVPS
jgi:nucleotide-binding universal stress UspA family protein